MQFFKQIKLLHLFNKRNIISEKNMALPLLKFGVLTDIQYANSNPRPASYDLNKTRFYREALNQVETAFEIWEKSSHPVSFAVQLGDMIDGINVELDESYEALKKTLATFESHCTVPTFHTVGNHELYNFNRRELAYYFNQSIKKMKIPLEIFTPNVIENRLISSPVLYYKFCPHPCLKFISLDCFEISVLGHKEQHSLYKEAAHILRSHHKHNNFSLWDCDGPLQGLNLRFQQMNGGISKDQLLWLDKELEDSDKKGQKVIVFGHVGLYPESSEPSCLLWNYEEVISCFHRHHCVAAYLNGHCHVSGYALDEHGIHYIVFAGVIETPPDEVAFATVSIFPDKIEIEGYGREESRTLHFPTTPFSQLALIWKYILPCS